MSILAFAILVVLSAAGVWLGAWAAGKSAATGIAICVTALALVIFRAATAHVPGAEEWLYEWTHYPYFKALFAAPALVVLVFLSRKAPRRALGVLLIVLACVVFVQASYYSLQFALAEQWYSELTGTVDETGYCPQTTPHTCGAAAAAMLLDSVGIVATEEDMARECLVRAGIGVTDKTLLRGIRRKLEGTQWRVDLRKRLSYDDLSGLRKPCLVSLEQHFLLHHIVVVHWMDEARVAISDPDPAVGRTVISRHAFERSWVGDAVALSRDEEPEIEPPPESTGELLVF